MIIISGSSNRPLASAIAKHTGAKLADIEISKFPNGEKRIWVQENLAHSPVAIIQSFSEPVDEHIIEFALIADACKHLRAGTIIGVVPWLGYSPQDKSFRPGEPISVHVIARIIETIGVDNLITADIHSQNSLKLFNIPVTHVSALELFATHFAHTNLQDHVVAALDKGALQQSTKLAKLLKLPLCVFSKTRNRHTGAVKLVHTKGQVRGKTVIAIDDFVSTGSTRIAASLILKKMGATAYIDCITHALLAHDSSTKLQQSSIDKIITTDTYHIPKSKSFPKLTTISIAPLLSQAIQASVAQ